MVSLWILFIFITSTASRSPTISHMALISAAYNLNQQFNDNSNKNINLEQL